MAKKKASVLKEGIPIPLELAGAFKNVVVIYLKIRNPGFSKSASMEDVDVGDVDKSMLSLSKSTIDSPKFRAIINHHSRVKSFLRMKALPIPKFFKSCYAIPHDAFLSTMKGVDKLILEHDEELRPDFIRHFDEIKAHAKTKLRKEYNEADYPSKAQLRQAFSITVEAIHQDVPGELKSLDAQFFAKQQEALTAKFAECGFAMRNYKRVVLQKLLEHLHQKLQETDADGRPKMIRKNAIENIEEYLMDYPVQNVTNDTELTALTQSLQRLVVKADLETIRHDERFRQSMANQVREIKLDLNALITSKPRKIRGALARQQEQQEQVAQTA